MARNLTQNLDIFRLALPPDDGGETWKTCRRANRPHYLIVGCAAIVVCAWAILIAGDARASDVDARPVDAGTRAAPGLATPSAPAVLRETFVVEAFVNAATKTGPRPATTLDHLGHGLAALVAERLGAERPLRFVGGSEIFSRPGSPRNSKFIVRGRFDRRADWKLEVTVTVHPAARPQEILATASQVGSRDDVARVGLRAAWEAIRGVVPTLPVVAPPTVVAAFGRDPYAFVIYGRALSAYQGAGGPAFRQTKAIDLLKKSLVIDPRVPETRRYLGVVEVAAGAPGHARAMWTYALDVRPDYVAVIGALAAMDRAAGLPGARDRYARLLELDPEDLDARRAYGQLLADAGQLVQAQRELEQVIAVMPGDLEARRSLALVLASRHAGRELATELEYVVRLDSNNLDARMDLGAAYLAIGAKTEAAATYDEVLRRKPRHPGALKLAADLARERGDLKKAAASYAKLRWLSPQDPRPVFLMATANFQAGNLDAAERLFTEAALFPGMLADAYSNLGAIALTRGQPKQALWFLGRAVKRRPGRATIRYNNALALHRLGRDADAANELSAARAADTGDAGVRFLSGVVALRLGLLREAEGHFRATVELDPQHADARHNLILLAPVVAPRGEGSLSFIDAPTGALPTQTPRPTPSDARP